MKRVLCIRFPNWPIQCLQRTLRMSGNTSTALALYSPAPGSTADSSRKLAVDEDTRFIRTLFPSAVGGPAIVAVSPDAWTQGVRPGIPLAEARSMAQPLNRSSSATQRPKTPSPVPPAVEFHEWQPARDRKDLKATAELTRRYAPIVGLDGVPMSESLLLDITGCGPLFGGEAALADSLLKDLRQAGWSCRIAIAQSVASVWALTHASVPRRSSNSVMSDRRRPHRTIAESMLHELPVQIVPQGLHQSEINPLPVTASRLRLSDLEILKHLGIRTIGQLVSLPREDLPSRLSSDAVLRIQQLLDIVDEPIDPLPEANPVAAGWSSEEPATSLSDFRQILRHLTDQIAGQLLRRRLACNNVACQFQCADGSTVPLSASVVRPTQSPELLHEVLCLRIETELTLAELEESSQGNIANRDSGSTRSSGKLASLSTQQVTAISMLASVGPIPSARQRDLFSSTEHIVPQEELATLITRLSNRLGSHSVLTVRNQPDPRPEFSVLAEPVLPPEPSGIRQSHLDSTLQKLTDPTAACESEQTHGLARPLRLLACPQQISSADSGGQFPSVVTVGGKSLQITHYSAPERIQTAWWTDHPCHRDYYQVMAGTGVRLWIFRDLHSNLWFLHGIFD